MSEKRNLPLGLSTLDICCSSCGNPADVPRACCPEPWLCVRNPAGQAYARAAREARKAGAGGAT